MKKFLLISFLIFISCSLNSTNVETNTTAQVSDQQSSDITNNGSFEDSLLVNNSFTFINKNLELEVEDISNKKTIIIFWADYWSICRRELPVIESKLDQYSDEYDVIALAHSESGPTLEWVQENLNGKLKIGFSTPDLRDYFKIIGQPITIVLDQNGEIIFRDFGEFKYDNF